MRANDPIQCRVAKIPTTASPTAAGPRPLRSQPETPRHGPRSTIGSPTGAVSELRTPTATAGTSIGGRRMRS